MLKRTLAMVVLVAALLCGCSTPSPNTPQLAPPTLLAVPASCPAPNIPAKPQLPVAALTSTSSDADTFTAYAESLRRCAEYSKKLETILNGYRK